MVYLQKRLILIISTKYTSCPVFSTLLTLRVDNGPEFTGKALDARAHKHGVRLGFTRPGKPMGNGHIESFNGKIRDECLNQNDFVSLADARDSLERWRWTI